ncbi:MAG: Fe/S biogenesis protein NfuA [Chloroflexi bacterium RBG_16_48_8]|nr:MAG: Fe/S biogenesis protein NfuA [Chloroflexi bacterium RBG_16_48_8]
MLEITEAAKEKIQELMEVNKKQGYALRVAIAGRGSQGFMYQLGFVNWDNKSSEDSVVDLDSIHVLVDSDTLPNLRGSTLDYVEDDFQKGFSIENPNPLWSDPLSLRVQTVLDERVNPALASHGGFISLVEVKDDKAYVAMGGGCQGCGMASVTLNDGIIVMIKDAVPEISEVVDVTNHSMGKNPFYRSPQEEKSAVAE